MSDFEPPAVPPFRLALYAGILLTVGAPAVGACVLTLTCLLAFAFAARRQHVVVDEGGLRLRRPFGLGSRYVPFSQIARLEIEGDDLVARDATGKRVMRRREPATALLTEGFAQIDAAVAAQQHPSTELGRGARTIEQWLADLDQRLRAASAGPYRGQPWDWDRTVELFRNERNPTDVRAGAAWALLASGDRAHRAMVLAALQPSLPPLVAAVCALAEAGADFEPLARQTLAFLPRADRREWKRLCAERRSPARARARVRVATDEQDFDAADEPVAETIDATRAVLRIGSGSG